MADEDTQSREESLWWAFDAFSDSSLPTATFDEPLEWPDVLPWEEFDAGPRHSEAFEDPEHLSFDLAFPPTDAATAVEPVRPPAGEPKATDEGGDPTGLHLEPLPDSIWAADPASDDNGLPPLVTITGSISADEGVGAPTFVAEAERSRVGRRLPWPFVPRGNAAVVAMISVASLVLLGMFLAVRARNDVSTETSRTPTTQASIAATRPPNTVPLNTATSTPPSTISLSDLVPPPDAPADAGAGAAGAGTTPRATASPATTAPRSSAPAATQPTTATTAAPPPAPVDSTPPPTSPPASSDDTTQTTRRTTPSSIDFPRPTSSVPSPTSSIPWPTVTWPPGFNPSN